MWNFDARDHPAAGNTSTPVDRPAATRRQSRRRNHTGLMWPTASQGQRRPEAHRALDAGIRYVSKYQPAPNAALMNMTGIMPTGNRSMATKAPLSTG